MFVFSYFYCNKAKTFCWVSSVIENLYVTFYSSDVSENCDVSKRVVVCSSVQLCCANLVVSWMEFVSPVST